MTHPEQHEDPYVDGNLDARGDVRAGRPQVDTDRGVETVPAEGSLDEDLDSTPRTDGQGDQGAEADSGFDRG